MAISAADVKKLRDTTSAGMMECKKALEEADGDFDKAVEILRISGAAKAAKRGAEREASNGLVAADGNALVELLCETDFVAKNADFSSLAAQIAAAANAGNLADRDAVLAAALPGGQTVEATIGEMAGVIGEKLELGRVAYFGGDVAVYLHHRASDLPPQVGVLVAYSGDADAARGIAMQIAARGSSSEDRRGSRQRLLQGQCARRAAECRRQQEVGRPGAGRCGYLGHGLRSLRARPGIGRGLDDILGGGRMA